MKMMVSLPGVLIRAAEACERHRDSKYLGFGVRELLKHLRELRSEPTEDMLRQFFELYTDHNFAAELNKEPAP